MSVSYSSEQVEEPGIYVNDLTKPDETGLTVDEYETYVDAVYPRRMQEDQTGENRQTSHRHTSRSRSRYIGDLP